MKPGLKPGFKSHWNTGVTRDTFSAPDGLFYSIFLKKISSSSDDADLFDTHKSTMEHRVSHLGF